MFVCEAPRYTREHLEPDNRAVAAPRTFYNV
jgi:hypothetical protein